MATTRIENDFSGTRLHYYADSKQSHALGDFMGTHRTINRESLLDFLLYGSILPPHTPLEGVGQLYPGERIADGTSTLEYLGIAYEVKHKSIEEFVDLFDEMLGEYMAEHEDTSAVLLSGGIDSAILLSYLPRGATAITWGGRGEQTSDIEYSKISAEKFGVGDHHFVYADYERDLELYKAAVQDLRIPILFNSAVPFLRMAETGKSEGIKRWFVGQNADTVFMSYPAPVLTNRLTAVNSMLPFNPLSLMKSRKSYVFQTASAVRLLAYFKSLGVFPGDWIDVPDSYFEKKEALMRSIPARNHEQRIIAFEELLTESRRNQICQNEIPARQGIAALCPYYDRRFIELALAVPPSLRRRGGYNKLILKKLAEKRGVPESVIYKKKTGLSYGLDSFILEKKHLQVWDQMESDPFMNAVIDVKGIRGREQDNYLTFIMLSSLYYWFDLVARPHGLSMPEGPSTA